MFPSHTRCCTRLDAAPSEAVQRRSAIPRVAQVVAAIALAALAACHSAHIEATVSNRSTAPISLIQVEYPSATFGTQTLSPGQDFHYRFKVLGSGPMKITYTDASEKEQKATGPTLSEGSEGTLNILITGSKVDWQPKLSSK